MPIILTGNFFRRIMLFCLTHLFPTFSFDPPENIRKLKAEASFAEAHGCFCCKGFLLFSKASKKTLGENGFEISRCQVTAVLLNII